MEIADQKSPKPTGISTQQSQITADFETFLKMLTTQMQNQDPLNPMDADAFASQLATFSMVEQQTRTNQNLEALLGAQSSDRIVNYANTIGRSASHDAPFQYSGTPIHLSFQGDLPSEPAQLVLMNEAGHVVATRSLAQGQDGYTWDGLDEDGGSIPFGRYAAAIQSVSDGRPLETNVLAYGDIEEARIDDGRVVFVLADGTVISEDAVVSLR